MKRRELRNAWIAAAILVAGACASPAGAQDRAAELAKQVANPLASLISVPIQYNHDGGIGPNDADRSILNLQPVVPFAVGGGRWKVLSRTIVPVVDQAPPGPAVGGFSGIGDVTQSLFLTSTAARPGQWVVGAGPVMQLPTGSEPSLTTGRWSVGPTAIALRQVGPWTYGVLANHLWSVAGDDSRGAVSTTFVQPFINYITRTHTTLALNTEATRDWEREALAVPLHLIASQLLKVGPQPMSVSLGARYWVESPEQGPEGWGVRSGVTLLFPTARLRGGAIAR